jgi:hypothetical protein
VVAGTLANASESFLLAAVSVALEVVSAKLAAVSCWRTVVSLAAASARLSRAVPKRSMETGQVVQVGQSEPHPAVRPPQMPAVGLAFEVGETECYLPCPLGAVDSREAFPIIYLAREMLGREDCR